MPLEVIGLEDRVALHSKKILMVHRNIDSYSSDMHPLATGHLGVWNKATNVVFDSNAYTSIPFINKLNTFELDYATNSLSTTPIFEAKKSITVDNDIDDDTLHQSLYSFGWSLTSNVVRVIRQDRILLNNIVTGTLDSATNYHLVQDGAPYLDASKIDLVPWSDKIIVNIDGGHKPLYVTADGSQVSADIAEIENWDDTYSGFDLLIKYKQFLVGLNPHLANKNLVPNRVVWCSTTVDDNNFPEWTPTASNDAGSTNLSFVDNERIISAAEIGNDMLIFSNRATYKMSFIGGNNVFRFTKVFYDTPVFARYGTASYDRFAFVVTENALLTTNGVTKEYIANQQVNIEFYNRLKRSTKHNIRCISDPNHQYIYVFFNSVTNTNDDTFDQCLVWNWLYNKWSFLEFPANTMQFNDIVIGDINLRVSTDSAFDYLESIDNIEGTISFADYPFDAKSAYVQKNKIILVNVYPRITPNPDHPDIVGAQFQKVLTDLYEFSIKPTGEPLSSLTTTDYKVNLTSILEKNNLHYGDVEATKFLKRLIPHFGTNEASHFRCRVGTSTAANGDISWKDWMDFNAETDWKFDFRTTGKYLHVQFGNENMNSICCPFSILGFTGIGGNTGTI